MGASMSGIGRWRRVALAVTTIGVVGAGFTAAAPPASAAPPVVSQFTATLSDTNLVTLAWSVTGGPSGGQLDIEGLGQYGLTCSGASPYTGCPAPFRVATPGVQRYRLRVTNDAGQTTVQDAEVTVASPSRAVVPAARVHVDSLNAGAAQTLSWSVPAPTSSKDYVRVTEPSGTTSVNPSTGSLSIAAAALVPGANVWSVQHCYRPQPSVVALCSAKVTTNFALEGAVLTGDWRRVVTPNTPVTLSWSGSGDIWLVDVDRAGPVIWPTASYTVDTSQVGVHNIQITSCLAATGCGTATTTAQVVIVPAPKLVNLTARTIGTDFTSATIDTSVRDAIGAPLDATFSADGDIWSIGEFSRGVARVHDGVLTDRPQPIAVARNTSGVLVPTKPFLFGTAGTPSDITSWGERVVDSPNAIWYVQGGRHIDTAPGNHSRIIRVSKQPGVPDCAVHVPGDNNVVGGLAYDATRDRIWFTDRSTTSRLRWFAANDITCDNGPDYAVPAQVAAYDAANLCLSNYSVHCIHDATPMANGATFAGQPGHLVVDSQFVWVAAFTGDHLYRFNITNGAWFDFPLPTAISTNFYKGFPWQIRQDANAVYLAEYADGQLLRLNRSMFGSGQCGALANGANPCISEITVPMSSSEANVHSIALTSNRLWFTVANEAKGPLVPNASYFGYIDLNSWAAGTPTGVRYTDLPSLGLPGASDHWSVRGIEADAAGRIALADMGKSLVLLTPK